MYGAILGDMIGSPFEFDRGDKTKEFGLFSRGCQFTDDSVMTAAVAEAIIAFLESEDYEDAVRNAVSLGGDTDTLGAITGSIAEAYYDMPAVLRAECRSRVSEDILGVMQMFDEVIGRRRVDSEEYEENLKTDGGETEWNERSE